MSAAGQRSRRVWPERVSIGLLLTLGVTWVGAKVHFLTRFGADNVETYMQEHWPFWAAMTLIGVLLLGLGAVERRNSRSFQNDEARR